MPLTTRFKITIVGDKHAGKTRLAGCLLNKLETQSKYKTRTTSSNHTIVELPNELPFFDYSEDFTRVKKNTYNDLTYFDLHVTDNPTKHLGLIPFQSVDCVLYCVDPSVEMDIDTIKEHIQKIYKIAKQPFHLCLVGITNTAQEKLKPIAAHFSTEDNPNGIPIFTTSIISDEEMYGIEELSEAILKYSKQKEDEHNTNYQAETHLSIGNKFHCTTHRTGKIESLIELLGKPIDDLRIHFSPEELRAIDSLINIMIEGIHNTSFDVAHKKIIESFRQGCDPFIQLKYVYKNPLTIFAIAATIALIVIGIGFGLGCAFGAWPTLSAFIAGFFIGQAASIATVASGLMVGTVASSIYSFYYNPAIKALDNLVETAYTFKEKTDPSPC